jgi:hypothetical protein
MSNKGGWMPIDFSSRWVALPLVLLASLVPAASAHGALTLSGASAAPVNTQAGAHSNFTLSFNVTGGDQLRNLVTELPAGLVGNPTSVSYCNRAQLFGTGCPAASQVGSASSNVTATVAQLPPLPPVQVDLDATGGVFNMIPEGSDPATLGIRLSALNVPPVLESDPVVLVGHASARATDFGLNTTILDIPQTAGISVLGLIEQQAPVRINSTTLTLNDSFMTNPTSCGTKTTRILGT